MVGKPPNTWLFLFWGCIAIGLMLLLGSNKGKDYKWIFNYTQQR